MKMKKIGYRTISVFLCVFIAGTLFSLNSNAKKVKFLTSSVVPAAQGHVKVNQDNNQNYTIKIKISGLADIERLKTSDQTYIVWMETDQGKIENLGQLISSSGFLSKHMKATLETVSPFEPTKIFITTEDSANVQHPSGGGEVILTTGSF